MSGDAIKYAMRYALIILSLGLLLAACDRQDAHLARQVTGTWNEEAHFESETHYVTTVFAPDRSFTVTTRAADFTNVLAGTWKVQDRVILMTVTNANQGNLRYIGQVLKCRVDHVDSHEFDYQNIFERVSPTNTMSR